MKTKARTRNRKSRLYPYRHGVRIGFMLIVLIGLAMASCSDDNDKAVEPDTREQFVGSYSVSDISASSGYEYKYDVSISKGAKGDLEISNFADMMNVPVKAKAKGNQLVIESQTFKNGSSGHSITIEGSGSFVNGVLTFHYTTKGYLDYTGNCTAKRSI